MRDFLAALGLLTILPVPAERTNEAPREAAAGFYPWVGWLLGIDAVLIVWILGWLGADLGRGAVLAAVGIVAYWAVVTGGMHFDGLADTFDALAASRDRERRLEVMRDSRVGALGAVALLLTALAQVAAIAAIVGSGRLWPLIAAPVLGRVTGSVFVWLYPPARPDGLGRAVAAGARPYPVAVATSAVAALVMVPWLAQAARSVGIPVAGQLCCDIPAVGVTMVIGLVSALAVPRALSRVVGGLTGDVAGASIAITETIVLAVAAFWG